MTVREANSKMKMNKFEQFKHSRAIVVQCPFANGGFRVLDTVRQNVGFFYTYSVVPLCTPTTIFVYMDVVLDVSF